MLYTVTQSLVLVYSKLVFNISTFLIHRHSLQLLMHKLSDAACTFMRMRSGAETEQFKSAKAVEACIQLILYCFVLIQIYPSAANK